MSIIRCVDCDDVIDTDYEDSEKTDDGAVCLACAEIRDIEAESAAEDQRLDDPRHGQARDLNNRRN